MIAFDESLGYEVITIKHQLPHEGWMEFTMRSSLVNDPNGFLTVLYDNHVKVIGVKEKKMMQAYIEGYAQKLQRSRRMAQLLCQMGWKDTREGKAMFVLGKKLFHNDGTVEEASLAKNVPTSAQGFRSEGSLEKWTAMTTVLGKEGMEPFAFALLCGFGAPLMKFTGFDGAMVSLVGDSGAGKTLMLRMMLSIYGNHTDLMMMHKDTQNALVSRLGVYGTLPLAIDEVTNIEGKELSDLAYRITQGRDKARLTKNAEERKNLNQWNTLAVVSSNASLIDRLNSLKHDASAEINRIIEYPVPYNKEFSGDATTAIYWALHQNYGVAGEKYIQWLAKNVERLTPGIESVRARIDKLADIRGEERFWSAVAAAAIYGGAIAKSLGIIDFDVAKLIPWIAETIHNMRDQKEELSENAVGVLGQFLDEHSNNRLMIRGDCSPRTQNVPVELPRGALVIRHEVDNNKLFISRTAFKTWLGKRFGEYSKTAKELRDLRILRETGHRKILGANTIIKGAQVSCWVIDLTAPELGAAGLQLMQPVSKEETEEVVENG
jgi:energy-coupling factor transporter ATP-binding protein EcfA2